MSHLFAAALLLAAPPTPEKWTDPALAPPAGLLLWLDAGRQPAAWAAAGTLLPDGAPLDVWFDGSGQRRDFVQWHRPAQPRLVRAGPLAVVRFDGQDDCLLRTERDLAPAELTAFVVAVPRANPGFFRALAAGAQAGK